MKIRFPLATGVLIYAFLAPQPLPAAILTVSTLEDTTINTSPTAYFSNANWGGSPNLYISPYSENLPLVRFDTSGLSALSGATINSVTLSLTVSINTVGTMPGNVGTLNLSQVVAGNSGWVEGTGTGPGSFNAPGATNPYINKTENGETGTGTVWAGGGNFGNSTGPLAGNAGTPFNLGSFANITFTIDQTYGFALDSSLITGWMNDSTLAAAGMVMWLGAGHWWSWNEFAFYSSEAANASFRPVITVDYTAVPEPASAALALLGGALLLGVRRRSVRRPAVVN